VVMAIRDYGETPDDALMGFVTRVLGRADDPHVRVLALALSQGIRADFPAEVEREAETVSDRIPEAELKRRLDLRAETIFTIDPVDAKDFDDAIHVKERGDGTFELGVHIADVSHYVRAGTALDAEAFLRATSVYLVDRVIPMLPEHLSNRVCSLVPREDRLTYSCIMQVTADGELKSWRLAETVIHSKERFSYEGAQAILDGLETHPLADELHRANTLAQALTARRMAEGSVDFEQPEVKVRLDENGHAVGVTRKERMPTNRLIEEFMLLANRAVALEHRNRPFVYRVHEPPDPVRIGALAQYVKAFGLHLPHTDGAVTPKDLSALLQQVNGTDEGVVITQAALRAMSKARYSSRNAGHYGLAFSHYSHFTSPIRRYPDLIVHRLAKRYAEGGAGPDADDLEDQAAHCSIKEKEAEQAERESVKLKQVEYLQDRVGEAFDGVVTGAAKFGVFVELSEVLAEGLLHVREMRDDHYDYDERTLSLVGRHEGRRFRPGTRVRVVVLRADVDTREIDLGLED
jgi:ribonuclease R